MEDYKIANDDANRKAMKEILPAVCIVTRKKAYKPRDLKDLTRKADEYMGVIPHTKMIGTIMVMRFVRF